uniref:Left-right determination factor 2-like n=1 Tax=Callorhinchus milii TaxID=7868 RepID=A0A4W3H9H0_CALMI
MVLLGMMACALWAVVTAQGLLPGEVEGALLERLGLAEVPRLGKRDLENVVVPARVRNRYISLLHQHKDKERKQFNMLVAGRCDYRANEIKPRLVFEMKGLIPENSEVTMAELKIFQKGIHKADLPPRRHHRAVHNARISVYWVKILADGTNRTSLIDSRLVPILGSGWKAFDVTQAVHYWQATGDSRLDLEVWIEAERLGRYPPGYQAFHCVGGCKQPAWPFRSGERSCAVLESASLPIMYLVKKGDYTEVEVAEFPNMIVEKCGCVADNGAVM